ncbi:hypothetical protein ARMSODRAFT_1021761 [Armillaria solidipes]|uniref:Uncharacterized protein n=1 Tax=Armillaria solidipes TaxID=1076256 RepID=A0A2H3BGJ1_9AGAR|nr:hypothetical protein ARMSODRAFT_1021761 [Armillaria solidipes]
MLLGSMVGKAALADLCIFYSKLLTSYSVLAFPYCCSPRPILSKLASGGRPRQFVTPIVIRTSTSNQPVVVLDDEVDSPPPPIQMYDSQCVYPALKTSRAVLTPAMVVDRFVRETILPLINHAATSPRLSSNSIRRQDRCAVKRTMSSPRHTSTRPLCADVGSGGSRQLGAPAPESFKTTAETVLNNRPFPEQARQPAVELDHRLDSYTPNTLVRSLCTVLALMTDSAGTSQQSLECTRGGDYYSRFSFRVGMTARSVPPVTELGRRLDFLVPIQCLQYGSPALMRSVDSVHVARHQVIER